MGLLDQCDTQAERKMVYSSIGSCPTEALKKQVLEWSVSSVKLQDFFYPLNRREPRVLLKDFREDRGFFGRSCKVSIRLYVCQHLDFAVYSPRFSV